MAPIVKMHTLGHTFMPPGIHAGGLRYHGMAPAFLHFIMPVWLKQLPFNKLPHSRPLFSSPRLKVFCQRPKSAHAIRAAIDEALDAKAKGEKRTILFNLSGHGHFDMMAYQSYLNHELVDYEYPAEAVQEAMKSLPEVALSI